MSDGKRKPKKAGTDAEKPTRDSRGRWTPGYCPNPKGRPRKADTIDVDRADIGRFMNTEIEIRVAGELVKMTREAALDFKMYGDAMKGKFSAQKFMYERFQQRKKDMAEMMHQYETLMSEWVFNNPALKEQGIEAIPLPIRTHLVGLEILLDSENPGEFPGIFTRMLELGTE